MKLTNMTNVIYFAVSDTINLIPCGQTFHLITILAQQLSKRVTIIIPNPTHEL